MPTAGDERKVARPCTATSVTGVAQTSVYEVCGLLSNRTGQAADLKSAGRRCSERESGFTLVEVMIAAVIITVGLLGLAYAYGQGMSVVMSSQQEAIARQKAREAMEDVLTARNIDTLTWSQINNVSNGGVFIDGPTALTTPGPDGMVNTADDGADETIMLPGPDGLLSDGTSVTLGGYTRQIQITTLSNVLKQITVTITYVTPPGITRSYQMTCYVSPYI
ncbi:MAG: type IV pilus modification PilV family protein [Terriglobia bacterium]